MQPGRTRKPATARALMLLPDVNILVYALRDDFPDHSGYRQWLEQLVSAPSAFAVSELVLSAVVRMVTNPRVFRTPTPTRLALDYVHAILHAPTCTVVRPGARHFEIFTELCRATGVRGNDVADAYHAALAIESGSEWVTADRGFGRFPRLRWRHPLD